MRSSYYYKMLAITTLVFTSAAAVQPAGVSDACDDARRALIRAKHAVHEKEALINNANRYDRGLVAEYHYARVKQYELQQRLKTSCPSP